MLVSEIIVYAIVGWAIDNSTHSNEYNSTGSLTSSTVSFYISKEIDGDSSSICAVYGERQGLDCELYCRRLISRESSTHNEFARTCKIDIKEIYEYEKEQPLSQVIPYLPVRMADIEFESGVDVNSLLECSNLCNSSNCTMGVFRKLGSNYDCLLTKTTKKWNIARECRRPPRPYGFCESFQIVPNMVIFDGDFTPKPLTERYSRLLSEPYHYGPEPQSTKASIANVLRSSSLQRSTPQPAKRSYVSKSDLIVMTSSASVGVLAAVGGVLGVYLMKDPMRTQDIEVLSDNDEIIDLSINSFA